MEKLAGKTHLSHKVEPAEQHVSRRGLSVAWLCVPAQSLAQEVCRKCWMGSWEAKGLLNISTLEQRGDGKTEFITTFILKLPGCR